jgi:polygalacturonase
VYLADNVTVELESGCTVLGTTDKSRYGPPRQLMGTAGEQYSTWAIFAGKGLRHIAIRGRGTIDGQGSNFKYKDGPRPKNLYFEDCQDVLIEGVRLRDAGSWMQHYRNCERLTIRDIAVFNHVSYNNDGLNIDSCRDVTIVGCMIDSDDDAVVLKSLSTRPTENVTISDCVISSHCNSIKMGTESGGGFRNITVTNCTIVSPRYSKVIYGRQRGLAGVALEIVDGGTLDRVAVSNLAIKGVTVPIFMRLGNRARTYETGQPKPGIGTFRNVVVGNIVATDCSSVGCSITGLPGHRIENVTLSNISLGFDGGGTRDDAARDIPEKPGSYPESTMFGTLPAYGFFCRHVTGLKLHNVRLRTAEPDLRHAVMCDDVEDVLIDGLDAPCAAGAASMLRLTDARRVAVCDCHPPEGTDILLTLRGDKTETVSLYNNNFDGIGTICDRGPKVPQSALIRWANHPAP